MMFHGSQILSSRPLQVGDTLLEASFFIRTASDVAFKVCVEKTEFKVRAFSKGKRTEGWPIISAEGLYNRYIDPHDGSYTSVYILSAELDRWIDTLALSAHEKSINSAAAELERARADYEKVSNMPLHEFVLIRNW